MRRIVDEIKSATDICESPRALDLWRANYDMLTYAEHQEIWEALFSQMREQCYADAAWFLRAFRQLADMGVNLNAANVVELGSYDGWLGAECMREFNFASWTGYEMIPSAVARTSDATVRAGVKNLVAERPLWEMAHIQAFDIFVSAHTIEHLSTTDCMRLLDFVCRRTQVAVIELPTLMPGQTWTGTISSHVLGISQQEFVSEVQQRWLARFVDENAPAPVAGDKMAILRLLGREKMKTPRVMHRDTDITSIVSGSLMKGKAAWE